MSGDLTTRLDKPYAQQPATRPAATRFLERTGNADVLAVLGLVDEEPEVAPDEGCAICGNKLPSHGVCRKSGRCREAARERGESA